MFSDNFKITYLKSAINFYPYLGNDNITGAGVGSRAFLSYEDLPEGWRLNLRIE
jgi:hypothetical protein